MAEKINGHIQFNGVNWQFYKTMQSGLNCEFDDHRSCTAASDKANAEAQAADDAQASDAAEAVKAEVQNAAEAQTVQAGRDEINEAGRRKHEATRQNGLVGLGAQNAAKQKAADALAKAQALFSASQDQINADLNAEVKAAVDANVAKQNEINATDWLAQVHAENVKAALDKQAQAEADAKAKADADAKALVEADAKAQETADKLNRVAAETQSKEPAQAESPDAPSSQSATPETAPEAPKA